MIRVLGRRAVEALRLGWTAAPWAMLTSGALAVVDGMLPVASAWGTKLLLDELVGARRPGQVTVAIVLIGLSLLLMSLLRGVSRFTQAILQRELNLNIQERLFSRVNSHAGLSPFEDSSYLDKLRLAEEAGDQAPAQVSAAAIRLVQSTLQISAFLVTLLVVWPPMVMFVLAAAIVVARTQMWVGRKRAVMMGELSTIWRRGIFYRNLLTDLRAAKEVRLFGLGGFLQGLMLSEARRAHQTELVNDRRVLRTDALLGGITALVAVIGTVVAGYQALQGQLSVGDVTIFIADVAGVSSATSAATGAMAEAYEALLLFGHYLDVVAEGVPEPGGREPHALREGIVFDDVWFRYGDDGPWVLRGATFTLPAGQSVGLVGVNGAGKSTLVKLLCRFYQPQAGRILWDGVALSEIDPVRLRDRVSAVFQDYMAYDLSAQDNIGIGRLAHRDNISSIRAAASAADIDRDIRGLPAGYRTLLSKIFTPDEVDGAASTLSGGQWQRMAIARAFLRDDADLLILDEPSSGLDAEAEAALHQRLHRLRQGRSSLLISHRLAALRDADRIIVLDKGRVVEEGSHAELLAHGGVYARLFHTQAAGYLASVPTTRPNTRLAGTAPKTTES